MTMNNFDNNFTLTTATTGDFTFIGCTDSYTFFYKTGRQPVIPNKNWMPYKYFEYEPKWHKKFARYKLQMEKMWN